MEELELIHTTAEQVLQDHDDMYLVDVELKGSTGNRVVWIYVESDKGNISLDRCASVSREVNFLLDASGWHNKKYTLNVSSPGLDRPLKDVRQYASNIGRKTSVVYLKDGEPVRAKGMLVHAESNAIILQTESKKELTIPFSDIVETYILPPF